MYISLNIQSLQSKFKQLCNEILELEEKNVCIDVIALQEVWDARYPELFLIPGYKPLICKTRHGMRGGGVGFFVKEYLNMQILEEKSLFENKIMESLTIKISYPDNRKVILSSVYRSNGIIHNVTPFQQMDRFLDKFSNLLSLVKESKVEAYICMDSNIDLLKLHIPTHANFLNLIFKKSFLPAIEKATRCQNESKTLIDQILFNKNVKIYLQEPLSAI
jgi:exonuclease III